MKCPILAGNFKGERTWVKLYYVAQYIFCVVIIYNRLKMRLIDPSPDNTPAIIHIQRVSSARTERNFVFPSVGRSLPFAYY